MTSRPPPEIELPYQWQPRPYQRKAWKYLEDGGKRAALAWHRRAGKDDLILRWTSVAAFLRPASYWHMLPEASQARKAIWEAVNPHTGKRRIDEAFPKELRANTREDNMFIRFVNGSTWQVVGSDNFDSLVGSPPAGVVFSEYALADPRAWAMLRPILLENGGWSVFISTPRGRNHFKSLMDLAAREPGWFAQTLTVEDTGVFTPEQLQGELRELCDEHGEAIGDSIYKQEYHCSFESAVIGAYYGALMERAEREGRIGKVPWEPSQPVHTVWDLGMRDATAIWFVQVIGREIHFVDYLENTGQSLGWYVNELGKKPYTWGRHALPHDVEVRELATGKSRRETLEGLGLKVEVVPKLDPVEGRNAVRQMLPKAWFNADATARGVAALQSHRAAWDPKNKVLSAAPIHDWSSHAADAMRYTAVALGYCLPEEQPRAIQSDVHARAAPAFRPGGW